VKGEGTTVKKEDWQSCSMKKMKKISGREGEGAAAKKEGKLARVSWKKWGKSWTSKVRKGKVL